MSSGLQRGTVRLMPCDSAWPQDFAAERRVLADIFGDRAAYSAGKATFVRRVVQ